MILHKKQREVVRSPARFKIGRAGRRSGKISLEIEDMAFRAMPENDSPGFNILRFRISDVFAQHKRSQFKHMRRAPSRPLEYWLCQFIYFGVGARRLAESSGARIC